MIKKSLYLIRNINLYIQESQQTTSRITKRDPYPVIEKCSKPKIKRKFLKEPEMVNKGVTNKLLIYISALLLSVPLKDIPHITQEMSVKQTGVRCGGEQVGWWGQAILALWETSRSYCYYQKGPQTWWPFTPTRASEGCQSTKSNNLGKAPIRKGCLHIPRSLMMDLPSWWFTVIAETQNTWQGLPT